jgi:hypothetical protein
MTCAICGALLYPAGQGGAKCMRALGRGSTTCWNHVQVNCALVRERLVDLLLQRLTDYPGAMDTLISTAYEQVEMIRSRSGHATMEVDLEIESLQAQADRLAAAIAQGGDLPALVRKSKEVDAALKRAQVRRRKADRHTPASLPASKQQLEVDPRSGLLALAATSFEFGQLMRKIIPTFQIQPVQALDCGQVHPRGLLMLDLGRLAPPTAGSLSAPPSAESIVIDLFEPPEHIRHLSRVVDLQHARRQRGEKVTLDILANHLHIGRMTVKRALGYQRLMLAAGVNEPYRILADEPLLASRWKQGHCEDPSPVATNTAGAPAVA